jgi:hypothetical protein
MIHCRTIATSSALTVALPSAEGGIGPGKHWPALVAVQLLVMAVSFR